MTNLIYQLKSPATNAQLGLALGIIAVVLGYGIWTAL